VRSGVTALFCRFPVLFLVSFFRAGSLIACSACLERVFFFYSPIVCGLYLFLRLHFF
jgi:hypothetical protein